MTKEAGITKTCIGKGSCIVVDATVWVQPRCSSNSKVAYQSICMSTNNRASCFPYCMAARRSGSGAQGLTLYSASEWKNRVHLMDRDCSLGYLNDPSTSVRSGLARYAEPGNTLSSGSTTGAQVTASNDALGGSVMMTSWDPSTGTCRHSSVGRSVIGKDVLPAYQGERFPSIPLPGQPFSFSGDTTLTSVRKSDGTFSVRVDRLYGSMNNEFTMVNVLKDFPSSPPAATVWIGTQSSTQTDKLTIPYAFNDEPIGMAHPSVSSESAVYFVVNPSTAMFEAFQTWCSSNGQNGLTQLQALSSYGKIRMWRIEPFGFCPQGDDGREGCGPGHVKFVDIPGGLYEGNMSVNDARRCTQEFTPRVTSLEYLNVDNIAVTYLWVRFDRFDIASSQPFPGNGTYITKYYNPAGNFLKDTPWESGREVSRFPWMSCLCKRFFLLILLFH